MTEDEKTACKLLRDLCVLDTAGNLAAVVRYLVDEREACAAVCYGGDWVDGHASAESDAIAEAIRARADR